MLFSNYYGMRVRCYSPNKVSVDGSIYVALPGATQSILLTTSKEDMIENVSDGWSGRYR